MPISWSGGSGKRAPVAPVQAVIGQPDLTPDGKDASAVSLKAYSLTVSCFVL
jgi:hypothetical protein